MTGSIPGLAVELYLGGSWVDVTAWHAGEQSTSVHVGRSNEYGDVSPGTLDLTLRNEDGRFTPRSAISPYYPDVIPGAPIRLRKTISATTYDVFTGKVVSWEPSWPGRSVVNGVVRISATDALADLAAVTVDDRWTEEARVLARTGSTWVDIPELSGDYSATGLDNLGRIGGASTSLGTITVVPRTDGVGPVSYGTPSALTLSRAATFDPSEASAFGSVIRLTPQGTYGVIDFWLLVPEDAALADQCVVEMVDGSNNHKGSLRLADNAGVLDLRVLNADNSVAGTLVAAVADGAWRHITLAASGVSTIATVSGAATAVTASINSANVVDLYWGALTDGSSSAKCSLAGIVVSGGATAMTTSHGQVGQTFPVSDAFAALQRFVPAVTSWATEGGEDRTVGEPTWSGKSALDVLQQLARTVNGVGWCRGDGAVALVMGDVARPATPADTLDVDEDLDAESADPTFRDGLDGQPTRVKIAYAGGSVTAIDDDAEAAGRRLEVTVDTCAADQDAALFAGDYVLTANAALRFSQVAVNLYSAVQDLWAAMLDRLFPTQLLRLDGWPAEMAGDTALDVHVQGWALEISEDAWRYTLDCSPAGLFPSATWDGGDDYGRWSWGDVATVTSGTALGTTGVGTAVITFSGGFGLTTDPTAYPLYLDWDGEAVRVDAPPAGTTSPQTVTIAARGEQSTAAQIHLAGESVDIWHAAVWGF